jgi:undecaprenyl pyrophosphate synthase
MDGGAKLGIGHLTLFSFSSENWSALDESAFIWTAALLHSPRSR